MRQNVALLVLVVLMALGSPVSADDVVKHSGRIVGIADGARTFVLEEVGPWKVRNGETVMTRQVITLLPETRFTIVGREDGASSGFKGDFVEMTLAPEDVYLYDYVTVECRHEGGNMLALKIMVMELPDGDTGEQTLR
jgi:hypothetical protein